MPMHSKIIRKLCHQTPVPVEDEFGHSGRCHTMCFLLEMRKLGKSLWQARLHWLTGVQYLAHCQSTSSHRYNSRFGVANGQPTTKAVCKVANSARAASPHGNNHHLAQNLRVLSHLTVCRSSTECADLISTPSQHICMNRCRLSRRRARMCFETSRKIRELLENHARAASDSAQELCLTNLFLQRETASAACQGSTTGNG